MILVVVIIRIVVDKVIAFVEITPLQIAVGFFESGIKHRDPDLGQSSAAVLEFFLQNIEPHTLDAPAHIAQQIAVELAGLRFFRLCGADGHAYGDQKHK